MGRGWDKTRRKVLRNSSTCYVCGQPGADEVDHIIPRFRGGSDSIENLRPVHVNCHARKSAAEGHARRAELRKLQSRPSDRHPGRAL